MVDCLIDCIGFYTVLEIFQSCNGGTMNEKYSVEKNIAKYPRYWKRMLFKNELILDCWNYNCNTSVKRFLRCLLIAVWLDFLESQVTLCVNTFWSRKGVSEWMQIGCLASEYRIIAIFINVYAGLFCRCCLHFRYQETLVEFSHSCLSLIQGFMFCVNCKWTYFGCWYQI